jgi:hypothetical protein
MLYIFAGRPRSRLHAGGLQYCIETVENLAILEHDPVVQYRKEGVFVDGSEEMLYPIEYRLSQRCLRDGITWDWFPENWCFGNGVTIHKTTANPEYKTVVHGTDLNLDEFLAQHGPTRLIDLELERVHVRHEGWQKYEARWLPGTCPQEGHAVHLTWLITTHNLPDFVYNRIRALVEEGATPEQAELYVQPDEPGKYLSTFRPFKKENHAVPVGGLI